jgi:glutamyl-tRNA synthetase
LRTRLAPSPTGALHLGNARTFLLNWLLARKMGWEIVLRIEDLDGPRIKAGADAAAIADLQWLGLDWDEGPIYQSSRLEVYQKAMTQLIATGRVYPCVCSRKEVEQAASAPHAEDGAVVYPGTCRDRFASMAAARAASGREPALRFRVPPGEVRWMDAGRAKQVCDVSRELGDFVIAKADGTPAYQLAVVVDDAAMGVTHIVRGDDLIDSTPRQILVYRALGLADQIPEYRHLPLVTGEDGRRLAKRHGDTRLSYYREMGVTAGRILALLARWCNIAIESDTVKLGELLERFDVSRLPGTATVFTETDDRWLRGM